MGPKQSAETIAAEAIINRMKVRAARNAQLLRSLQATNDYPSDLNRQTQEDDEADGQWQAYSEEGGLLSTKDQVDSGLPDGLFSGSKPRSNDKLLEQLLGKKAANAHRKVQKRQGKDATGGAHATPKLSGAPAKRKVEDDDSGDEGGRAAAIKSKKSKKSAVQSRAEAVPVVVIENAELVPDDVVENSMAAEVAPFTNSPRPPRRVGNTKPASFLDELLSKKSKKQKKKAVADASSNG